MNNNDFMHILSKISKNNNQRHQIICLGIIAGFATVGIVALIIQNRRLSIKLKWAKEENEDNSHKQHKKDMQINEQQNKIDQLIADKENRLYNHNPIMHTVT